MSDWPTIRQNLPKVAFGTCSPAHSQFADMGLNNNSNFGGGAVWPAANRAIYSPVRIEEIVTVTQMSIQVATASGNMDVGIYDEGGTRLTHVSAGTIAVPAAGLGVIDVVDVTLNPGVYFFALCVDNTTASIFRLNLAIADFLRSAGIQQQAVGAVTLPVTATFANPASGMAPLIMAHGVATV